MKVSVIIPCYNQAHYLEESVQSALDQTYPDIEIIIVNDGSPDNTQEVADRLQKKYPDIVRVVTQENKGLSEARNSGIAIANGNYILPLDADDRLDKKMISRCMDAMLQNNADIVYSEFQCFEDLDIVVPRKSFDKVNILYENQPPPSSLYRKSVWQTIGGYKKNMDIGYEDWEFWINAYAHHFIFHKVSEILFYYRVKKESMYVEAYKKHLYLKAKIVMNHPGLYIKKQVSEAIATIKKTEKLPDFYFYIEKNISDEKEKWIEKIDYYLKNNLLKPNQILEVLGEKIGLYSLDILKEDVSIKELCRTTGVDDMIFYAPMRYEMRSLQNSRFAWDKEKGIVESHGTLFPFVFKSERENPELQEIAAMHLLNHAKQLEEQLQDHKDALKEKDRGIVGLQEGKEWLEGQYYSLIQTVKEKDQEIVKLQEGKE